MLSDERPNRGEKNKEGGRGGEEEEEEENDGMAGR